MGCLTSKTVQIALIGLGGSGKSTIAKHLKMLHCGKNAFGDQELLNYKEILLYNVSQALSSLVEIAKEKCFDKTNQEFIDEFLASKANVKDFAIDLQTVNSVRKLMKDEALKDFIGTNSIELETNYNFEYIIDNLERICDPDWVPSEEDILHARQRTSGVTPTIFETKDPRVRWKILDAGGQTSEIRKWHFAIEPSKVIIYCVSLNEFDIPSETPDKTCMECSIELFSDVIEKRAMDKVVLLFLNKMDLFKQKLGLLKNQFRGYKGKKNFDSAIEFISSLFLKSVQTRREVFIYPTCALDRVNMGFIFTEVVRHVTQKNLTLSL